MKQQKVYDRQTKNWVHPDNVKKLSKKKTCKGGRPHEFKLCLPSYVDQHNGDVSEKGILEYYLSEDRIEKFKENEGEILDGFGIKKRFSSWPFKSSRHYKCEVCGKQDYR